MHLIFLVQSKAHYRYYSPLIYYGFKESFKITVFENKSKNLKVKFFSFIEKKNINFDHFNTDEELNNLIDKTNLIFLYHLILFSKL